VPTRVYVDGVVVPPADAQISIFDRGFLYGDAVIEVLRTRRGRPVDLEAHLDRLDRSARAVRMEPPARAAVIDALTATLDAAREPEARIRIVLTRGQGDLRADLASLGPPLPIVIVEALPSPRRDVYERGVAVVVMGPLPPAVPLAPAAKTSNSLGGVLATAVARDRGADEAIRCDAAGRITEAAFSNVFAVVDGVVTTPPVELGLLPGVTRGRVLTLCQDHGLAVAERAITVDELRVASEVFLTSSVRGVVPVRAVDGVVRPVGPTTRRVLALYQAFLESL